MLLAARIVFLVIFGLGFAKGLQDDYPYQCHATIMMMLFSLIAFFATYRV